MKMTQEEFDKMIALYNDFMIRPTAMCKLESDVYDNIQVVFNYNYVNLNISFIAIRKRPEYYAIEEMYCHLIDVSIFDIERWYSDYMKVQEKSKEWRWSYQYDIC